MSNEQLIINIEPDARTAIKAEMNSLNAFYDRLEAILKREFGNQASLSEKSPESPQGGENFRGGEAVEIIGAVACIVVAARPIVIAWIKSRGFEVEETETIKNGTVIRKLRVFRGVVR